MRTNSKILEAVKRIHLKELSLEKNVRPCTILTPPKIWSPPWGSKPTLAHIWEVLSIAAIMRTKCRNDQIALIFKEMSLEKNVRPCTILTPLKN